MSAAEVGREDAKAVPLSDQAVARLRQSRTWTRVVAVAALAFSAAVMLTTTIYVVRLARTAADAVRVAETVVPAVVGLAAALGCERLGWAYADGVDAFLRAGEPGLARAFRATAPPAGPRDGGRGGVVAVFGPRGAEVLAALDASALLAQ